MKRRAFTLIELLVVIAIIGLLATVAVVQFSNSRAKASLAAGLSFERSINDSVGDRVLGQWDFDDCTGAGVAATTAADLSGSGNSGTVVGAPLWSSDAPTGNGCSMYFDGGNNYVNLGTISSSPLSQEVTFSAWVKNETRSSGGVISKGLVNGSEISLIFGYSNPLLLVARSNGPSSQITYPWVGALLSGWHHVAMTVGSNGTRLYVDGRMVGQSVSTAIGSNTEPFQIGFHGTSYHFRGYIDDARIYAAALQ